MRGQCDGPAVLSPGKMRRLYPTSRSHGASQVQSEYSLPRPGISTRLLNNPFRGVISGFGREVVENCALLRRYTASFGNFLPTVRDNLSVPYSLVTLFHILTLYWDKSLCFGFLAPEVRTDRSSRNVGKIFPLLAT